MKLDDMTIGEAKQLSAMFNGVQVLPFSVGEKVFIRTVTHHLTGRVSAICGNFIVLDTAAWIADDGRFMECIEQGKINEVEPVSCPVRVNTSSIIDVYEWRHELPTKQK
jgi:hypothetical protein